MIVKLNAENLPYSPYLPWGTTYCCIPDKIGCPQSRGRHHARHTTFLKGFTCAFSVKIKLFCFFDALDEV